MTQLTTPSASNPSRVPSEAKGKDLARKASALDSTVVAVLAAAVSSSTCVYSVATARMAAQTARRAKPAHHSRITEELILTALVIMLSPDWKLL